MSDQTSIATSGGAASSASRTTAAPRGAGADRGRCQAAAPRAPRGDGSRRGLQRAQRGQVAAPAVAARVRLEGAAQVVQVADVEGKVDAVGQLGAPLVHDQTSRMLPRGRAAADVRSRRPCSAARSRAPWCRRSRGRWQTLFSRVAVPRQTAPATAAGTRPAAPSRARRPAQRAQLGGLGVGAEQGDVGAHLVLDVFVAGSSPSRASRRVRARRGAGAGVVDAFLDDHPGGRLGHPVSVQFLGIGRFLAAPPAGDGAGARCQGWRPRPMRATMVAERPST